MSFPAYPEYKDSGVPWLGKVPGHWRADRISRLFGVIGSGTTPSAPEAFESGTINWVTTGELREQPIFVTTKQVTETAVAELSALQVYPKGTLLIAMYGATIGRLGWLENPACTNQACCAMAEPTDLVPRFAFHCLSVATEALILLSSGGGQPNINQKKVRAFRLPVPPLGEQRAIAAFLDWETAKIDALVAEQERLIALLKEKRQAVISHAVTKGLNPQAPMKDSGIEWLGEIPAHWEVVRLDNLYREAVRTGSDDLPILSVSIHRGVSDHEIPDEDMERNVARSEDRSKYKRVQPNDLVYNMMRAWQGGFGAVQTHGQVSPAYVVAEPTRLLRSEFIEAVLRTPCAVEEMRRHSRGVTDFRLRLYWDEFKDIKIALPPPDEIDAILAHSARIVTQFSTLEDASRSAISLLQERRGALISAAVTGKIDVRGAVVESNVVPIRSAEPTSGVPALRAVVGAYAIRELGPMGRMAVMKAGFLAEAHAGFSDLNGRYERFAAGPYDRTLLAAMEQGANELCGIVTREPRSAGDVVTYHAPSTATAPLEALRALVGENSAARFREMLSLLKGIGRDGVEAVATIYAVWNDLLADGQAADDQMISRGVLTDWHPEKAKKFKQSDLAHWLAWMRRHEFVPDGSAPRTDNQPKLL